MTDLMPEPAEPPSLEPSSVACERCIDTEEGRRRFWLMVVVSDLMLLAPSLDTDSMQLLSERWADLGVTTMLGVSGAMAPVGAVSLSSWL